MHVDIGDVLLVISGVSATLIGTFIVGVFFYLDLDQHRSATSTTTPIDRYLRSGVRWVFAAYSLPLLLPLVLVVSEPIWGALTFAVLSLLLLASTVGTVRRIVTRGGAGSSVPLILNEWITTIAILIGTVLPWVLGGWVPPPSAYIPSLLITIAAGFASTAALIMSEFDSTIAPVEAPVPTSPGRAVARVRLRSPKPNRQRARAQ